MITIDNIIKGIFLLILAVCGNFIAETLGCEAQKLLSSNMVLKQIIIFIMIYFAIGFTDSKNNPTDILKSTSLIWVLFLMYNRMNVFFMSSVFILLAIKYVIFSYINYYNSIINEINENDSENLYLKIKEENVKSINNYQTKIDILNKIQKYILYLVIIIIIIGFILYTKYQLNEYKHNWSTFKYIFGIKVCKSLKK